MLKRVWSIAVILAMLLSMICVVSASAEDANAAVQLNNSGPAYVTIESSQVQVGYNSVLTVDVYLNDYANNLASMGLEFKYDPSLVSLPNGIDDIQAYHFGSDEQSEPDSNIVFELADGSVKAVWFSLSGENIVAESSRVKLLTMKFKTLTEVSDDDKTAVISAETIDGSMATVDGSGSFAPPSADIFEETIESEQVEIVKAAVSLELSADKTELRQGQKVTVDVKVKDFYTRWAVMSLVGSFDSDVFDVTKVTNTEAFPGSFAYEKDTKNYALAACWINVDDMSLEGNVTDAVVMKVELTARTDVTLSGDTFPIQFSFVPDGNYSFSDPNAPISPESGIYIPNSNELSMKVLPRPYLSLSADKTTVPMGGTVNVTVRLNEFRDQWAIMSLVADFDQSVFEIVDIQKDVQNLANFPGSFIAERGSKAPLAVSWVNMEDDGTATPNVDLMVVTLKVKKDLDLDENTLPITFSFAPDGNISLGLNPNAALSAEDGWYIETSEELEITIADRASLELSVDKTELKQGEEFTVDVTVKDLSIPWAMLSFKTNFDSSVFEVVEVIDHKVFPGNLIYEPGATTPMAFCWFNTEDVLVADPSAKVVSIKLRAKETAVLSEETYPFSVSFAPDGNISFGIDSNQALSADYYIEESNVLQIKVAPIDQAVVAVKIEWGNMLFEYDAGEWDTETHRWVGGGWKTATDFNKIAVINQGQVDVGVAFEYQNLIEGMSGAFSIQNAEDEYEPLTAALSLPKANAEGEPTTKVVWFNLSGLPQDKDALGETAETVGTVTITILSAEGVTQ